MIHQAPILRPAPAVGAFLIFDLAPGREPRPGLEAVARDAARGDLVVGVGEPLALALGARVPGLRAFPAVAGPGVALPSTQAALVVAIDGEERGAVHDRATEVARSLGPAFVLSDETATFRYRGGRDLTGYEDGTENPKGDAAIEAAIVRGAGPGLDGASFVAVQRWAHDLARFAAKDQAARDATIGRRRDTNEELPDAPPAAHVKRAAQESFDPPAFMLRRSMPWGDVRAHGLVFVAYVASLDRFERVLRRMAGEEDGVPDALFDFTRAVSGGYYFCPPLLPRDGGLDLRALGAGA